MAWEEQLFAVLDDLEQQAGALYGAERAAELADRSRSAYAEVTLEARLMASVGDDVGVEVAGVGMLSGRMARVATGWFVLGGADQDWVVRTPAVLAVRGASGRAVPEQAWSPVSRLGMGSALRRLADAAEPCVVHRIDGAQQRGVVRRVGHDFLELATGETGAQLVMVALTAVAAVQSRR